MLMIVLLLNDVAASLVSQVALTMVIRQMVRIAIFDVFIVVPPRDDKMVVPARHQVD